MGRELYEHSPLARAVFEEADAALGSSLSRLMFEGPAEELKLTENQQPALLTVGVAAWRALTARREVAPVVGAGHSLGEYTALVVSGAMPFTDAVRAVRTRGRLMQQAVPVGQGTMAAVIGLDAERIEAVVAEVSRADAVVAVAGHNTPEQTTISGSVAGVEAATAALKEAGAKRVLPLRVSAPFHCPLMQPVEAPLREELAAIDYAEPAFPVVTNVEAAPNRDAGRIVDLLIRQLAAPVLWVESVQAMRAMEVDTFLELGPGRALTGMLRKIDRALTCLPVGDLETLDAALTALA